MQCPAYTYLHTHTHYYCHTSLRKETIECVIMQEQQEQTWATQTILHMPMHCVRETAKTNTQTRARAYTHKTMVLTQCTRMYCPCALLFVVVLTRAHLGVGTPGSPFGATTATSTAAAAAAEAGKRRSSNNVIIRQAVHSTCSSDLFTPLSLRHCKCAYIL